mgnify:CR=1 FL=1
MIDINLTYCLKHYRRTFPDKPCDMCAMDARIEELEKAATEVVECGVDAMAYDRRQVLDALAALLQEPTK